MLLQSQGDAIEILPALPTTLPVGKVVGICARGGFVLSYNWVHGQLQYIKVTSTTGGNCKLMYHGKIVYIITQKGASYDFDGLLNRMESVK